MSQNKSTYYRSLLETNRPVSATPLDVKHTNIKSTSSFFYDPLNTPLKNSQQINVDWSKFENHTFFSSAEAKVGLAFDQIINGYPFDGTKAEFEAYLEKLTGFDKWVLDQFPKYRGYLAFSGTQSTENPAGGYDAELGTWIRVKDHAGSLYPGLSKTETGASVLSPVSGSSLTIEALLYVPALSNGKQVIAQKRSSENFNFGLYVDGGYSSDESELSFIINSGSVSLGTKCAIQKGQFNHVCGVWNRESLLDRAELYVNESLSSTSELFQKIGDLNIDASDFLIGSGSSVKDQAITYTPVQTFSGSIDELRVFHSIRTATQQKAYAKKGIFASEDLKLYYKFNEPNSLLSSNVSDQINTIVLDSSGNSLHSTIQNYDLSLRTCASSSVLGEPLASEKDSLNPVLFPTHGEVVALSERLMLSASLYDRENPNLITRLVPEHYIVESQYEDAKQDVLSADYVGEYSSGSDKMPGDGQLTSTQIMLSFLYVWARLFDDIKLYLDSFSTLKHVDYTRDDTVPDSFLLDLVKSYGFYLPPLFNDSTIEQYVDGENVTYDGYTSSEQSLKYVQSELIRRVLVNMPGILRSKGTKHSIKAFLRSIGIDPDNTLKIKEYGGPYIKNLSRATHTREKKIDTDAMVTFFTSSLALSPFLSGSRIEPGRPYVAGTMVEKTSYPPHGISNDYSDGMYTSGSWTVEGIYKYDDEDVSSLMSLTQSLVRICNYEIPNDYPWQYVGALEPYLVANLLTVSSSLEQRLVAYVRPGDAVASPFLTVSLGLPPGGVYDGNRWNVCFGCERSDSVDSAVSSSYFVRAATQNDGDIVWRGESRVFFQETPNGENNVLRKKTTPNTDNFLAVGTAQSFAVASTFLNDSTVNSEARATDFDGKVSRLKFWSKALTMNEFVEHTRNYRSAGIRDPLTNYNFNSTSSGSFEKLRLETFAKQDVKIANSLGELTFVDFSLNEMHFSGTGFSSVEKAVNAELFDHSYVSPYFDQAVSDDKIRIRSYADQSLIDDSVLADVAPVYELLQSETPIDSAKLSIEFSLIDALNRDIMTIIESLEVFENAIGAAEVAYAPDYPDLHKLRDIYFNRIKEKLNFQAFFEFFRWFDNSIGTFIEQLVPRKSSFKGTNYVIEPHVLERNKFEYVLPEIYLLESERQDMRNSSVVQQIDGDVRRF